MFGPFQSTMGRHSAVEAWLTEAAITGGPIFELSTKRGEFRRTGLPQSHLGAGEARRSNLRAIEHCSTRFAAHLPPVLCHLARGELEQIQFFLGM